MSTEKKKTPPKLKVVTDSLIGNKTRIYYITDEEEEVEISHVISGLDIHLRVDQVNKITLYGYVERGEILGELEEFVVYKVPPIPEVKSEDLQDGTEA